MLKKAHMLRCAQSARCNVLHVRLRSPIFRAPLLWIFLSSVRILLLPLALFAYGDVAASQAPANWQADWELTQKAAEKEGRLIIYGPTGSDQQKLYTEVFQQAHPKIKVHYTPGRISEIISRIMAEQRAGIRQADLVLGGTDILLGTLKD